MTAASAPAVPPATRASLGGRAAATAVRGYQRFSAGRRSPCRFVPSCSCYAVTAFEDRGLIRGGMLATGRILRCNPWGPVGFDPVPERASPSTSDELMP